MEELVRYLVSLLVDEPDQIEVTCRQSGNRYVYLVRVAPGDIGKVIGRQGRTAGALRELVEAAGLKRDLHATMDILS